MRTREAGAKGQGIIPIDIQELSEDPPDDKEQYYSAMPDFSKVCGHNDDLSLVLKNRPQNSSVSVETCFFPTHFKHKPLSCIDSGQVLTLKQLILWWGQSSHV